MSVIRIDKDVSPKENKEGSPDAVAHEATAQSNNTNEKKDKAIEIVVDGPLGHMYTQALAAIYAKESMMNEAAVDEQLEDGKKDETTIENKNTNLTIVDTPQSDSVAHAYVYAIKGSDLANQNTSEVTNKLRVALDKQNAKTKYLAIEDDNKNIRLFESISLVLESTGATLIRNQQRLSRVFK